MLPEIINDDFLNSIKKSPHKYYDKTVSHAEEMGVHVNGDLPEKLLNIQRPNESPEVKRYRLEVWQPVTKSSSEKVVNTLNKIFNKRLYKLDFPEMKSDSLADYLLEKYPFYRSIMNYLRETYTPSTLADPNAAMVIIPKNFDLSELERFEPIPVINRAETLVDYVDSDYYVFDLDEKIHIYTKNSILYYKKKKKPQSKQQWELYFEYNHNFGIPPVFRLGGIIKGKLEPYYYESFMAGVLPHWNQVVNLSSDLQPQYTNHMFLEKWEVATNDCDPCKGTGQITIRIKDEDEHIRCEDCGGSGQVSRSPYGVFTVNKDALNPGEALPTPPFGYPTKPIEIVDKVEARIKSEQEKGFASINLEVINQTGANQSGIAKVIDRQDLDSYLLRFSNHVFEYVLNNMVLFTAAWRYPDKEYDSIKPEIRAPRDLNVLTLDQLSNEYKDASNSNVSTNYKAHLEKEIIRSKFVNNERLMKFNELVIDLNPFFGRTIDELLTLQNLGEPNWKIYKSNNVKSIINSAIFKNPDFLELGLEDKIRITNDIAKEESGFVEDVQLVQPMREEPVQEVEMDDVENDIEEPEDVKIQS